MAGRLRVTQVRSTIGHIARNRGTIRALGLRRIGDTVEVPDNDATRGMVRQVRFLVAVEPIGDGGRAARTAPASREEVIAPEPVVAPEIADQPTAEPSAEAAAGSPSAKEAPPATTRPRRSKAAAATEEKA